MAKVDRVAAIMTELAGYRSAGPEAEKIARVRTLLTDKQSFVVLRAVELVGQWGLRQFLPDLIKVFERHFGAADQGCEVKTAVAKLLVDFEVDRESDAMPLIVRGLTHVQKEPVWGGQQDVAAGLRGWCAMAIAASGHRDQIRLILPLLQDPEVQARAMAVRSLALGGSDAGEALIRFKLLIGDAEDEVLGECLSALASQWPDRSMEILKASLEQDRLRPVAAVALGECRHAEALPILKSAYERESYPDRQRELLAGLVLCRREEALTFLVTQIEQAAASQAAAIVEALGPRRQYATLWDRVVSAVKRRTDAKVTAALARAERG